MLNNTKKLRIISRILTITGLILAGALLIATHTYGQSQQPVQVQVASKGDVLTWLPGVTFALSIVIGILNLWVINKLNKSKEEILVIVRGEFNDKLSTIQDKAATKEQVDFLRVEVKLMLKNIEQKIDNKA